MMNLFAGYLCTPKNIKPFWKYVAPPCGGF
jgi:hypothetical protein